jgi:hypothetical protein
VDEDRRARGVDARCEIVDHEPADVVADLPDGITVGDDLVVRDHDEDLGSLVLEANPVAEAADVVADVERAGRSVAGEHPEPRRVASGVLVDELG